jgi:hypothetical protein
MLGVNRLLPKRFRLLHGTFENDLHGSREGDFPVSAGEVRSRRRLEPAPERLWRFTGCEGVGRVGGERSQGVRSRDEDPADEVFAGECIAFALDCPGARGEQRAPGPLGIALEQCRCGDVITEGSGSAGRVAGGGAPPPPGPRHTHEV